MGRVDEKVREFMDWLSQQPKSFKYNIGMRTKVVADFGDYAVVLVVMRRPDKFTFGVTSRTEDGKHVIFLDYDHVDIRVVRNEVKMLQREFGLPDFHIFASSMADPEMLVGNYHAVCFAKFSAKEIMAMMDLTTADQAFKSAPMFFPGRSWVIRVSAKWYNNGDKVKPMPMYVETVRSEWYAGWEESRAHYNLFNLMARLSNILNKPVSLPYRKLDNFHRLMFIWYSTMDKKFGWMSVDEAKRMLMDEAVVLMEVGADG